MSALWRGVGLCLLFTPMTVLGLLQPDLTAIGAHYPDLMRVFNGAALLGLPLIGAWLALLVMTAARRWAVIYGHTRHGRSYLGPRLGAFLPWRRIRCAEGMRVDLGVRPSRTDRHDDKWLLMTVRSGRRHIRIRSMRPTTERDADRLRTWLAAQGVEAVVAFDGE